MKSKTRHVDGGSSTRVFRGGLEDRDLLEEKKRRVGNIVGANKIYNSKSVRETSLVQKRHTHPNREPK